jgi:prepilin-type N-terminal cleavage/methylation domain-containing protein
MAPLAAKTRHEDGFTLIEVLVSLTVLVAAIALLQGALRGSYRSNDRATQEMTALEIARSRLAAAGVETPLAAGVTEGEANGGFHWRVVMTPEVKSRAAASPVRGFWTTAEVEWRDRQESAPHKVSLVTLKIHRSGETP